MGADKWALGPSFVVVTFQGKWTLGGVIHNVWSVGGSGKKETNNFYTRIFANYNIGGGWYAGSLPIITANWYAPDDGWMIPIGGTVGKEFRIGRQMSDFNIGCCHHTKRPPGAPRSKVMFIFKFLWPRKWKYGSDEEDRYLWFTTLEGSNHNRERRMSGILGPSGMLGLALGLLTVLPVRAADAGDGGRAIHVDV